jgi:hypothetical protein
MTKTTLAADANFLLSLSLSARMIAALCRSRRLIIIVIIISKNQQVLPRLQLNLKRCVCNSATASDPLCVASTGRDEYSFVFLNLRYTQGMWIIPTVAFLLSQAARTPLI